MIGKAYDLGRRPFPWSVLTRAFDGIDDGLQEIGRRVAPDKAERRIDTVKPLAVIFETDRPDAIQRRGNALAHATNSNLQARAPVTGGDSAGSEISPLNLSLRLTEDRSRALICSIFDESANSGPHAPGPLRAAPIFSGAAR